MVRTCFVRDTRRWDVGTQRSEGQRTQRLGLVKYEEKWVAEVHERTLELADVWVDSALHRWVPTAHDQQASPRRQPACQAAGGELSAGLGAQAPGRMDSVISWYATSKQIIESRTFLRANSAYRKQLNASPLRAGGDEVNECKTSDAGTRAPR